MTDVGGRMGTAPRGGQGSDALAALAGTRIVALSAAWNIAGRAGPMVIAVAATPFLYADLGPTRWGLFALALSLIGVFGIFDFGIGRALTKLLAERIALGAIDDAAVLTRTGLVLLTLLGGAGALVLAARNRWKAEITPHSAALRMTKGTARHSA